MGQGLRDKQEKIKKALKQNVISRLSASADQPRLIDQRNPETGFPLCYQDFKFLLKSLDVNGCGTATEELRDYPPDAHFTFFTGL
jgi:hypothetical protein